MNGDFLGFSFDGIHSSRLGITRVSDGDRYDELLVPEIEDQIIEIPGGDGSYFFGSLYRNKEISVSIAFDSLNESQFRQLRKLLATKKPGKLIFDERPYKVYTAKISSPPEFHYVCFDERKKRLMGPQEGLRVVDRDYETGEITHETIYPYEYDGTTERIYKGEGTITFTCIQPFATDQFKVLDLYGDFNFQTGWYGTTTYRNNPRSLPEANSRKAEDSAAGQTVDNNDPKYHIIELDTGNSMTIYTNVNEWAESSGILPYEFYARYNIDKVCAATNIVGYNAYIPVYNAGDIDAPFYLFLPFNSSNKLIPDSGDWIDINLGNDLLRLNSFKSKTTADKENGVVINTNNHLIEGVKYDYATSGWRTTGNLYNEYIVAGDFTKIKSNDWNMFDAYDGPHDQAIYLNCRTAMSAKIHYNYLYY